MYYIIVQIFQYVSLKKPAKTWRLPGFTFQDPVFSFVSYLLDYRKKIQIQSENDLVNLEGTVKEL